MLARYGADYADTVLTAPIDGTVTHVNIRIGESLPVGAAVTLLGDSPYRIEMFVSEIDIPKVLRTQSGSIELDAFRNAPFTLRVGDVDTAATDKDGVPKYRVRLDFVQRPSDVKVGMTGDAEITTDHRASALHVPARSVLSRADGTSYVRVLPSAGADIVETDITTGIEGSAGEVEVLSGLMEGQTVVVLEKK
jgi:HlyD family secretion protein